jgi:osmoprotectant transport system substrate-binding protein
MRRHNLLLLMLVLPALALGACGGGDDDDNGGGTTTGSTASSAIQKDDANASTTITVGSKNFTEEKILGEIYAQAFQAAGYAVKKQLNLGDEQTALKALQSGQIDTYPEYTGTALLSFFGYKADKLPKNALVAYADAKKGFAQKGLTAFPPTPFTDSNEVAVTKATADKYHLANISDLKPVAGKLTLYGSPECRQRLDCLLGLEQVYGLHFKKFVPVEIALRHEVLEKGQADVSIVFTTDPQIKRQGEVLLKDDKHMFPPYNATLVMRDAVAKKGGTAMNDLIVNVNKGLTAPAMQELNARVDLDKKTPQEVAKEYLSETHLTQ